MPHHTIAPRPTEQDLIDALHDLDAWEKTFSAARTLELSENRNQLLDNLYDNLSGHGASGTVKTVLGAGEHANKAREEPRNFAALDICSIGLVGHARECRLHA